MATVAQALALAAEHHQAGRLAQAQAIYQVVIAEQGELAEALHALGVLAYQGGRLEEAIGLLGRAIAAQGNFPEAYNNLGTVLGALGQREGAIAAHRMAVTQRPEFPEALYNLGNALKKDEQVELAVAAYRQALVFRPGYAEALNNLGVALGDQGRVEEARAAYHEALRLKPNYAEAWGNLGNALLENGQADAAEAACRRAIALYPDYAEAHYTLGNALSDKGRPAEAVAECETAIALKPNYAEAHSNLGNALKIQGRMDEAIAAYRQAVALKPDSAEMRFNLGLALLQKEEWAEGWEEYEWRWKCKGFNSLSRYMDRPRWDGTVQAGRTVLLHAEQGAGDAIEFIRFASVIAERGMRVIVEAPEALVGLLGGVEGVAGVYASGATLPAFDVQLPLMSVPRALRTRVETIPARVPYLWADARRAKAWAERMGGDKGFKVGLCWAGSPLNKSDRLRSMALSTLGPLGGVAGVTFYSLQKGAGAEQASVPPAGMKLVDRTGDIHDFGDTAALMAGLDLIISVDTAVAHLAGALGRPVWTMLHLVPGQFWLLGRTDSPWYPTMQLFRARAYGAWEPVVRAVAEALAGRVREGGGGR